MVLFFLCNKPKIIRRIGFYVEIPKWPFMHKLNFLETQEDYEPKTKKLSNTSNGEVPRQGQNTIREGTQTLY
jgi:hypothetical protein